jgi:hypothetical protein
MAKKRREPDHQPIIRGWPIALGAFLAVLGIVVPIAWDRYSSSTSLLLEEISAAPIINTEQAPDELTVTFRDTEVENLSNYTFRLQNTGRRPIRATEVVEYPSLKFHSARIFDTRILDRYPKELKFEVSQDDAAVFGNRVNLVFPLLNPDEWITFSILLSPPDRSIAAADAPIYDASTRITGVRGLDVARRKAGRKGFFADLSWTVYVVAFATFVTFAILEQVVSARKRQRDLRKDWIKGELKLPEGGSVDIYRLIINLMFERAGGLLVDIAPILRIVKSLSPDKPVSPAQHHQLSLAIERVLGNYTLLWVVLLVLSAMAIAGGLFVAKSVATALGN